MKRLPRFFLAAAFAAVASMSTMSWAQPAEADPSQAPTYGSDGVKATGIGIAGGVIAGAELVIGLEALFGVDATWAYLTFPLVGAAGGGVGGYFLEQNAPTGASVGLLVASVALIIPTIVVASVATAYDPGDEMAREDPGAAGSFSFELAPELSGGEETRTEVEARPEGVPEGASPPPAAAPPETESEPESETQEGEPEDGGEASLRRERPATGSLFVYRRGTGGALAVPGISVVPTSAAVRNMSGASHPGVEVHVSLIKVAF